jgi:hypothetical protein
LFTGLIRDARDGCLMHLTYAGSSRKNNTRVLVSKGARNGEDGSLWLPFPYDRVEQGFLKAAGELRASDILGNAEDDRELEMAGLSGKLQELDEKISKIQHRVMEETGIESLVSLLEKLDREKKETAAKLDKIKSDLVQHRPEALQEVQSLASLLRKAKGKDGYDLKLKTRARIRQPVSEMWMIVYDVPENENVRMADLQVFFHGGKVRTLGFVWCRRGKHRGLTDSFAAEGRDLQMDLRKYRDDPKTKKLFDRHVKKAGPIGLELIETKAAAIDALKDFQKESTKSGVGSFSAEDEKYHRMSLQELIERKEAVLAEIQKLKSNEEE